MANPVTTRFRIAALAAALSALTFGLPAHAVDSGGGGGGGSQTISCGGSKPLVHPNGQSCVAECPSGSVPNQAATHCVSQNAFLYEEGRQLALAGDYDRAINVLNLVTDREDPMVLTMTGFALRKSGKVDEGIAMYHQALAIDPDNPYTLEYLGEGHVAAGDMPKALEQLARLKATCGEDCEQYQQLANVIAGQAGWQ